MKLPPDKQKAFDAVMSSLNRRAMEIVEIPKTEREQTYLIVRDELMRAMRDCHIEENKIPDWIEQYLSFLRSLVAMIESGGGASGGRA
jgi:hypothetical protein